MPGHILDKLEGLSMGAFSIELTLLEPMRMSGWRHFVFVLRNSSGSRSVEPLISGIHSLGGKGIPPWIEITDYHRILTFKNQEKVDLRREGLEPVLYRRLYNLLDPGSHIMVWYEGESGKETDLALMKCIPPSITELGFLILSAGFLSIRNFHLPEGGHEGGRKLWGERPLNAAVEAEWKEKNLRDVISYFIQPVRTHILDLELTSRLRILDIIRGSRFQSDHPDLCRNFREICSRVIEGEISVHDWTSRTGKILEDSSVRDGEETWLGLDPGVV